MKRHLLKLQNKKGIEHGFRVVLFVLVIFAVVFTFSVIIDQLVAISLRTYNMENYILYNRLILSPNSIFSKDKNNLVEYGTVDLAKFTEETLQNLYVKEKTDNFAFKATLLFNSQTKSISYNKNVFELGTAIAGIKGARYSKLARSYPVTIRDGENSFTGILKVESILKEDERKYI